MQSYFTDLFDKKQKSHLLLVWLRNLYSLPPLESPSFTCEPEDIEPTRQALEQVDVALASSTVASYSYPTVLYQLFFCGEERRYPFLEELGLVSNLNYEVRQRIIVETPLDEFSVTFTDGSAAISSINEILAYRKEQRLARVDPLPDSVVPPGDDTPTDPGNETELFTTGREHPWVLYVNARRMD